MLSQGIPMIVSGDEVRRTQNGNNNAYCQDNEISWFDWERAEKNRNIFRFFKWMIDFRKAHSTLHRSCFFTGEVAERGLKDVSWHGCRLHQPGFDDPDGRVLAFTLAGDADGPDIHVILNMYWEDLDFDIPDVDGRTWFRVVDTARPSPEDIVEPGQEVPISDGVYRAKGRSVVVLVSR